MISKSIAEISSFIAGDSTIIQELLHPKNEEVDINYSLALAKLEVNTQSDPHILENQSELYFILEGEGIAYIGEENKKLSKGDFILIPEGVKQFIVNTGKETLQFLCIVSPPWKKTDEIILE
ncbi:MAG: cupin domain-containing protein [Bacteroidota bacterium]